MSVSCVGQWWGGRDSGRCLLRRCGEMAQFDVACGAKITQYQAATWPLLFHLWANCTLLIPHLLPHRNCSASGRVCLLVFVGLFVSIVAHSQEDEIIRILPPALRHRRPARRAATPTQKRTTWVQSSLRNIATCNYEAIHISRADICALIFSEVHVALEGSGKTGLNLLFFLTLRLTLVNYLCSFLITQWMLMLGFEAIFFLWHLNIYRNRLSTQEAFWLPTAQIFFLSFPANVNLCWSWISKNRSKRPLGSFHSHLGFSSSVALPCILTLL